MLQCFTALLQRISQVRIADNHVAMFHIAFLQKMATSLQIADMHVTTSPPSSKNSAHIVQLIIPDKPYQHLTLPNA
jgi:hypothetical protein